MPVSAKQKFLKAVGEKLPLGHHFLKVREAFYWDREDHLEMFGTRVLDRSRKMELSFGLSFPAVQKVFESAWPIDPKYRAGSYTIAAMATALDPKSPSLCAPVSENEFGAVADDVVRVFSAHDTYFRDYASLPALDRLLNEHPEQKSIHCSILYRGAIGVIVSSIVGGRDLSELVAQHRVELSKISRGFYLPNFDRVVQSVAQACDFHL